MHFYDSMQNTSAEYDCNSQLLIDDDPSEIALTKIIGLQVFLINPYGKDSKLNELDYEDSTFF